MKDSLVSYLGTSTEIRTSSSPSEQNIKGIQYLLLLLFLLFLNKHFSKECKLGGGGGTSTRNKRKCAILT